MIGFGVFSGKNDRRTFIVFSCHIELLIFFGYECEIAMWFWRCCRLVAYSTDCWQVDTFTTLRAEGEFDGYVSPAFVALDSLADAKLCQLTSVRLGLGWCLRGTHHGCSHWLCLTRTLDGGRSWVGIGCRRHTGSTVRTTREIAHNRIATMWTITWRLRDS